MSDNSILSCERLIGNLFLTHSSRKTDLDKCTVQHFINRYENVDRLSNLPPFDELPPYSKFQVYDGAMSVYKIYSGKRGIVLREAGTIRHKTKIQHAAQINDTDIVVGFENYLEIWRFYQPIHKIKHIKSNDYFIRKKIEHPHLPGIHTVFLMSEKVAIISASGSDAVFTVDLKFGKVIGFHRMPASIYGKNYDLTMQMNLNDHFIHNDCQTTHINSAFPITGGRKVVVSALIQGVVGILDVDSGSYKELVRGYTGCHGARINDRGQIYFADSSKGTLVFLDIYGDVINCFQVDSSWLHDVHQIYKEFYAFSLADRNELRVYNINTGQLVCRRKYFLWEENILHKYMGIKKSRKLSTVYNGLISSIEKRITSVLKNGHWWLGNSTQFISTYNVNRVP